MSETLAFPIYLGLATLFWLNNTNRQFRQTVSLFVKEKPLMNADERAYVRNLAQKPVILQSEWTRVDTLIILFFILSVTGILLIAYPVNVFYQLFGGLILLGALVLDNKLSKDFYLVTTARSLYSDEQDFELETDESHDETQYIMAQFTNKSGKTGRISFQDVDELDSYLKR